MDGDSQRRKWSVSRYRVGIFDKKGWGGSFINYSLNLCCCYRVGLCCARNVAGSSEDNNSDSMLGCGKLSEFLLIEGGKKIWLVLSANSHMRPTRV